MVRFAFSTQMIFPVVDHNGEVVYGSFPWQSCCAFCLAKLMTVDELMSALLYITVFSSRFPRKDILSLSSNDCDNPRLPWMIRFHIVSIAAVPVCIVISRHVLLETIVSPEYLNPFWIVHPPLK